MNYLEEIQTAFTKMVKLTFPYALSSIQSYKTDNKDVRHKTVAISLPVLPISKDEPDATASESQTYQIIKNLDQLTWERVDVAQGTWKMFAVEILPKSDKDPDGTGEITSAELNAMGNLRRKEANDKFRKLFTDLVTADFNKDPLTVDKNKVLWTSIPKAYTFDDIDEALGIGDDYFENYKDPNLSGIDTEDVVGIMGGTSIRKATKYRYTIENDSKLFAALMRPSIDIMGAYFWRDGSLNRLTINGQKGVFIRFHKDAIFIEDPLASNVEFDNSVVGNKLVGLRYRDTMKIVKKGAIQICTSLTA